MSAAGRAGENMLPFSVNELSRILLKEIESPSLQSISADTFQRVAVTIGNLKGLGYEGIEARVRDRMVEMLSSCARILLQSRQGKLSSENLDYSKLTDEEKYVIDGLRESKTRIDEVIGAVSAGRLKVLELVGAKARSKRAVVRFLKPMEQFIGVDMSKYGPYKAEDVASIPVENVYSFIRTGIVVEIHASALRR